MSLKNFKKNLIKGLEDLVKKEKVQTYTVLCTGVPNYQKQHKYVRPEPPNPTAYGICNNCAHLYNFVIKNKQ